MRRRTFIVVRGVRQDWAPHRFCVWRGPWTMSYGNATMDSVNHDPTWTDANSSWMAKANRAQEHVNALRRHVDEFGASDPHSVIPEPADKRERLAYRLKILKQPPEENRR